MENSKSELYTNSSVSPAHNTLTGQRQDIHKMVQTTDSLCKSAFNASSAPTYDQLCAIVHDLTDVIYNLASKVDLLATRVYGQPSPLQSPSENEHNIYTDSNINNNAKRHAEQRKPEGFCPVPAPCKNIVGNHVSLVTRSKPLGQSPTFDGSGDLQVFKLLFQEWVDLNGWENDTVITRWLKQCITGTAKQSIIYDNIQDSRTLFNKLEGIYSGDFLIQKYTVLLEKRFKKPDESLIDLANDIRKMVETIYADCDSHARNTIALNYFIRALPSISMKYELSRIRPSSLDQAVQMAANYEFWLGDKPFYPTSQQFSMASHQVPNCTANENIKDDGGNKNTAKKVCSYCGGPHRNGRCRRRAPYRKRTRQAEKHENQDVNLPGNIQKQLQATSALNTLPTESVENQERAQVRFSHACHQGGTSFTGQRHGLV